MAIQIPDAGTGNGATGDNEFVLWTKVINNFSDATHAASKLVGTNDGQIPLAQDIYKAAFGRDIPYPITSGTDLGALEGGSVILANKNVQTDYPPSHTVNSTVYTDRMYQEQSVKYQTARDYANGQQSIRLVNSSGVGGWKPITTHKENYTATTANGANVVVDTSGKLMRSTSSERYKDILAPLELDDAKYADAMALKPIVYRSTADADNPAYHYYSFSAEELGAYDPAFTLWCDTETVTDADGNVTEQPLAERQAEGININALLAMGHAIAIKQGELIKDLQEQINVLKLKLEV